MIMRRIRNQLNLMPRLALLVAVGTTLFLSIAFALAGRNCSTADDSSCTEGQYSNGAVAVSVSDVVTDSFFNGIVNNNSDNCAGKNFYTRSAFLKAAKSYPSFGTTGSPDDSKREIAAFFAHVSYDTGNLCNIEETDGALRSYCVAASTKYPCVAGKSYYGRGPLQIQYNFNYGAAGESIGIDLLKSPETVAKDPVVSFKTAFWFWMNNVHSIITAGQGFDATIRAIDGPAKDCINPDDSRFTYYTQFCRRLGVSPDKQNLNLYIISLF